jgi:hypothetical protein
MIKLNRIAKLNDDMRTKYFVINQERDKLMSIMKDTPGMKNYSFKFKFQDTIPERSQAVFWCYKEYPNTEF